MITKQKNYAFIDGQNLYLGSKEVNFNLDYEKLRIYLKERFGVNKAFLFLGYISNNTKLYSYLRNCGYLLIFKRILISKIPTKQKGNIDTHLAFYVMKNKNRFDKAIIITSDGDFDSLVEYLDRRERLSAVITITSKKCSKLLKKSAKNKMIFLDEVKSRLSK